MEGTDLELFERSLRHATEQYTGSALDAALDELGWRDALIDDPRTAVSVLFDLQGRTGATSAALAAVVENALVEDDRATGDDRDVGVVLPALGRAAPPGELHGENLRVAGLGTAATGTHAHALVATRTDGGVLVLALPTNTLALRPVAGIDPALGLVEVDGETTAARSSGGGPVDWEATRARVQVAIGHELVGTSRTMLELAREHALERVQFGRPISQFQAIRHRLADTLVAIETAATMLDAAWLDGTAETAAMAKALAGRGARSAARHCQQVLAGIGFTTEHPLHRFVRRVFVLDEIFGSARSLTRELGDGLLATRRLPPLLPL